MRRLSILELIENTCPYCRSSELKQHSTYNTQHHGQRPIMQCQSCMKFFSPTKNTFMAGIRKPISFIVNVFNARTEGAGLNATCRIFNVAKNTVLDWERRLSSIKQVLLLYAMAHQFFQLIIEGDELYTKVGKNTLPDKSRGWTVVLMDRASRFLWELQCGKKDRKLFRKAIRTLGKLVDRTKDISLITDGEPRYGNILFEICYEILQTGKRGRPRKTLKKGVKVRIKNKGSQSHKRGRKGCKSEMLVDHADSNILV